MRLLLLLLFSSPLFAELPWQERKAEGWAWYEDRLDEAKKEKKEESTSKPLSATERVEEQKAKLEEAKSLAVIEPSEENIHDYIVLQKEVLDQGATFAKVWKKVLLNYPELDNTVTHPTSQYGIKERKQQDLLRKTIFIKELSKSKVLIFFYKGSCSYCKTFIPIASKLQEKYQWILKSISTDGVILDIETEEDQGLASKMAKDFGVSAVPALFVLDPKTKEATPIAYGLLALDEIEDKILTQFSEESDENI